MIIFPKYAQYITPIPLLSALFCQTIEEKYPKKCGPDGSILAGPLSKRKARIFFNIYILGILVSKQFATFLHISLINLLKDVQIIIQVIIC